MTRRALNAALAALVVPATAWPLVPATAHAPDDATVFVNEIHYDNDGTDTGEAIEVSGPAGTSLEGWSVALYNGNGGGVYSTRALSGTLSDTQGGYGTVALSYPTNGIQNGGADGLALVDAAGDVVQFLSYEGTLTATDGPAAGMASTDIGLAQSSGTPAGSALALTGSGRTYGDFAWADAEASFGRVNPGQTFGDGAPGSPGEPDVPDACETEPSHEIGAVQGDGRRSPELGQAVTVDGVVVGDFQASDELGGFFLQDADGDGTRATSDGIFVHDTDAPDLRPGDVVRVSGFVDEFYGHTQLTRVTAIGDCGDAALPAPTAVDLPASDEERERLEGMRVSLSDVAVSEVYNLDRYGEVLVSSRGRLFQPSNDGGDDAAEQTANERRSIVIDDGSDERDPAEIPFTDTGVVRVGDTVTSAVGVLGYGFGAYRLHPTDEPHVARTNPRPAMPDAVGGDVQVASFNVLNYFTTLEGTTDTGDNPRGASTPEELERQEDKIVSAISRLDADVVGLMEIENDADDDAVDRLVAALNERAGEKRYAAVEEPDTGGGLFGTDAIKVAMFYRPDAVVPMGRAATTRDAAFHNARLPLAQRFRPAGGGKPFTVVVNHFKSKGCGGATGENTDQGDGQGCWNADRVEQAGALTAFVGSLPGQDALVIGDLNAYGAEDPVDVVRSAGFVDLIDTRLPEVEQYSYVYFGRSGYLDHALASSKLLRRVTGADIWHVNADEAPMLDYGTDNPEGFYEPGPFRSSDHDPVLVGLAARPGAKG